MQVTVFGIVWILICIYILGNGSFEQMVGLLLVSTVFQCTAILNIANHGIVAFLITCIFVEIKVLMLDATGIGKIEIDKHSAMFSWHLFGLLCWISLLFTLVFQGIEIWNKYEWTSIGVVYSYAKLHLSIGQVFKVIKISLYIHCVSVIYKYIKRNGCFMNIGKYMDACVFIVCIFALLQYIMRDKPFWGDLLGGLIYNNIEGNMAYWDNDRRLFATFFEPSYCGMFLSASFWYYVEKKRVVFSTVLFLLVVFFNKSTTGYVVLFVGFLIWIIVHGNAREYLPYLIMGFVMILVIALSPIGETIRFNIVDKITVRASGQLRKSWDVECIRVLTETHFWGAGYGISRGNSGVATILANLGIEGLLLWLIALWKLIYKPMPWQDEGERVFLIVALVGIFASCPDLSMTIFWMGVIITLYSKAIEDRYAEELKIYADNKRLCFNNGKQ